MKTATGHCRTASGFAMLVAMLAAGSCVGPQIQVQSDVVRTDIEKARQSGAEQCAPRELALAESNVDFAENELAQGDVLRAQEHIDLAVTNANKALANSKDCGPKKDRDGDGLIEPDDKCPLAAGPKENQGCPWGDRDNDGVTDNVDVCPDAPEDKDGDRDDDGRPDLDIDNDLVEDCVDGCPLPPVKNPDGTEGPAPKCDVCLKGPPETTREDMDKFEDDDGCPEVDNDKDGLLDSLDACPNEVGPPESKGCPRVDTDGDGFYDDQDACPKEAGIRHEEDPKQDGCPKKFKLIVIKQDKIEIKQQVQFDTGKATIKPVSAKLLAEVGEAVRTSNLEKVTVEGHTDDVGDDEFNMNLSQERANSVRQWLIEKERVDPAILEAIGFGETKPIASNRTKAGRQQNRRVEFKVER